MRTDRRRTRSTSWATSSRRTSPTTGATRASSSSRTTCSRRRTRGACPRTSTRCRAGPPSARAATRCRAPTRVTTPMRPSSWKQSRYRKLMDLDADDEVPEFDDPVYAWTDITHLLHENDVSWASYIFAGEEPDCDEIAGPIICTPGQAARAHVEHLEPPAQLRHGPGQRPARQHQADEGVRRGGRQRHARVGGVAHPQRRGQRAPPLEGERRAGLGDPRRQPDHEVGPLGVDGHLRDLGRLRRLLRPRRCHPRSTRTATASGSRAS